MALAVCLAAMLTGSSLSAAQALSPSRLILQLSIQSSPNPAQSADSILVSGKFVAGKSGVQNQKVEIRYSTDQQTWTSLDTVTTGSGGAFSLNWKPNIQGRFYLQACFAGTTHYAALNSDPILQQVMPTPFGGGLLKAQGRSILDESGNFVLLRGVNFYGYEFGLWGHTEADYQKIVSWGFNVVRLPIAWNFVEPSPGKYDVNYFSNYVDRDISWAKKYGLYVILDMHQYGWSPYFTYWDDWHTAGVPIWSVSASPNTSAGEARAKADFWNGLGPNGSVPSDSNPSMQSRFIEMWKFVASRYVNEKTIAGFDVFNEPGIYSSDRKAGFLNVGTFSRQTLPDFYEKVIDGIRTVDGNHLCIWEPYQESLYLWQTTRAVNRPNIVYSPHYPDYDGYSFDRYDGNKASLEKAVASTLVWNQPVFMGEWGICANAANVTSYIRDFSDLMDRYLMGAAWWSYGKMSFQMALLDQTGNERVILTQSLIRPHLAISSVVPSSSSLSADARELTVILEGPCDMRIYVTPFSGVTQVKVDSGSASTSWVSAQYLMAVSLTSGATQASIVFA
jgi:hypothetical protein